MTRQLQIGGGYLAQSSKTLHFGLGEQPQIDRVVITWPGGRRQELKDVRANAVNDVREP
jgi:hypothetical protein